MTLQGLLNMSKADNQGGKKAIGVKNMTRLMRIPNNDTQTNKKSRLGGEENRKQAKYMKEHRAKESKRKK